MKRKREEGNATHTFVEAVTWFLGEAESKEAPFKPRQWHSDDSSLLWNGIERAIYDGNPFYLSLLLLLHKRHIANNLPSLPKNLVWQLVTQALRWKNFLSCLQILLTHNHDDESLEWALFCAILPV